MKACESHNETVVIFNGNVCPLCKAEKKFKSIMEEIQKSMTILKQIQAAAEEGGVKSD